MNDTTTVIRIGDIVTWQNRTKQQIRPTTMPLKITGCKVRRLFDYDGKAAAEIDCGRLFGNVITFVVDLDLEEEPQRTTILSGG